MRGVSANAAGVVRAGLRPKRDPSNRPAGHELQLPAARRRGARHGRVRQRPGPSRVSRQRGLLRPPGPFGPVQDGRHVRRHVLGLAERPMRHVPHVQSGVVRDAPAETEHQTVAAAQARLRRSLHQSVLQYSSLT